MRKYFAHTQHYVLNVYAYANIYVLITIVHLILMEKKEGFPPNF